MKLIYSLYINKDLNDTQNFFCGFSSKQDLLDCFLLSTLVSGKFFTKTELYCSTEVEKLIKEDGRFQHIDIINCFNEFESVDKNNWGITKIHVFQLQTEPFLHLDMDAIIWKKIPNYLLENQFLFQQIEPSSRYTFYSDMYDDISELGILPPIAHKKNEYGICTALFACLDMSCLDMIKEYYQNALTWCDLDIDYDWYGLAGKSIFFEQYFLGYFLEKYNYSFNTILEENTTQRPGVKFTHLIANSKRKQQNMEGIRDKLKLY